MLTEDGRANNFSTGRRAISEDVKKEPGKIPRKKPTVTSCCSNDVGTWSDACGSGVDENSAWGAKNE